MLDNIIKRVLNEELNHPMVILESTKISKELKYHLDNKITLSENVFRIFSESYFKLINEVRELYNNGSIDLNDEDIWLVESDIGKRVKLSNGEIVWLDLPFEVSSQLNEAKHRGKNLGNLNCLTLFVPSGTKNRGNRSSRHSNRQRLNWRLL